MLNGYIFVDFLSNAKYYYKVTTLRTYYAKLNCIKIHALNSNQSCFLAERLILQQLGAPVK